MMYSRPGLVGSQLEVGSWKIWRTTGNQTALRLRMAPRHSSL